LSVSFEIARVLVRFNHVASFIVNANDGLMSSRRLQRSWVFDIFCQKMSGNHPREFKKRSLLIVSARDKTISVVAVCISNPDCSPFGVNR
jgi:hypothetical protein